MDIQHILKVEAYLRKLFGNNRIRVVPTPRRKDTAEVYAGDDKLGEVRADEEDEEDYNFTMEFQAGASADIPALNNYLSAKFGNDRLRVVRRARKQDSLEAYLGDEFVGVLFIEDGKASRSYVLEIPILAVDL